MVLTLLAAVPGPGRGIQHCRLLRNLCSTQFLSKRIEILTETHRIADPYSLYADPDSAFSKRSDPKLEIMWKGLDFASFLTLVNCLQNLSFLIRRKNAKL
jgi:hypothetical protein